MPEDYQQDEIARGYAEVVRLDEQAAAVLAETADAASISDATNPIDALCGIWQRVRPIVVGAANFPLLPANIRRVLKQLIEVIDGICRTNS
jgi:hypothetical protein